MDKNKWSEANKFNKFSAEMRTNMELTRKSKKITETLASAIENEIQDLLVLRSINYPPSLLKLGIDQDTTYEEKKALLGLITRKQPDTENERRFIKFMENSAETANQGRWRFRIAEESIQKHKEGWYPFFITLTVDPKIIDSKEMWQSGKKWQSLVRRLSKIASDELGHPPFWKKTKEYPYRSITDYMTYASVIEHGKSREHHHLHALIWLKQIPSRWKQCPNRNVINPKHRIHNRCRELETYWDLGRCEVNYFRSIGDIYEIKHNFVIPLKDGEPMKVAPAHAAGAYITKYMQKDHKEWQHRMKATRNLGMNRLKKVIASLPKNLARALTWRPETSQSCLSLNQIHTVPLGLVRSIARQQHFYNQYHANELDLTNLMMIKSKPYIRMQMSVRNGARPDRMPFPEFYDWVKQFLPVQRGYCDAQLYDAHEKLGEYFPKLKIRVKPTKIGANKNHEYT